MQKKHKKVMNDPPIRIHGDDSTESTANTAIRLSVETDSEHQAIHFSSEKLSSKNTNKEPNNNSSALFESNILVEKLEGQGAHDIGRGFRSKDLSIEDLKEREEGITGIEDQWLVDSNTHTPWVKKLVITGGSLVLIVGGWLFYKVNNDTPTHVIDAKQVELNLLAAEKNKELTEQENQEAIIKTTTEFLTAKTIESRLAWCSEPDETLKKSQIHFFRNNTFKSYKSVRVDKVDSHVLNGIKVEIVTGDVVWVSPDDIETTETVYLLIVNSENGYRVDWASYANYQPDDYRLFIDSKSQKPSTFRVVVKSRVETGPYLYSYNDDRKYQAYKVEFQGDSETYLYAYTKVGSEQDIKMKKIFGTVNVQRTKKKIMLTLAFPADSDNSQCVEIKDVVSEHWFLP